MADSSRLRSSLGPGGEFDLIRQLAERLGSAAHDLGDDCAYLSCDDRLLAISTDSSAEGTHFRREWLSLSEIGYRAAAAAVSDLAAAGARTPSILAAVSAPDRADVVGVMDGIGEYMRRIGGQVIGGDVIRAGELSITVTAIGTTTRKVGRSGARPGDGIWVTGALGLPRAALLSWQRGEAPMPGARRRFAMPESRLEAGEWLVRQGATAMLDVSDGLASDAQHLAAASACALVIDLGRLPIDSEVGAAAVQAGVAPAIFAAYGGEDYELLVTLPPDFAEAEAFAAANGIGLTRIGTCEAEGSQPRGTMLSLHGVRVPIKAFNHY